MQLQAFEMLVLHAVVTAFMTGVIAVVQLVHYPLFSWVNREAYPEFQRDHMRRITWVVGLPMLLEAVLALLVCVNRPTGVPGWLALLGLGLLGVIWLSTVLQQVPQHERLLKGFNLEAHERLVRSNRVRTVAWFGRLAVALAMLAVVQP